MTLYLDTSSLVKLYAIEDGTDEVRALIERADLVATSSITFAEIRATLSRLRRERQLTTSEHTAIKRQFTRDWAAFLSIKVTDTLAESAGELAEEHGLRGCDAIQLASFVQVLETVDDDDVEFSSYDERLNKAARALG